MASNPPEHWLARYANDYHPWRTVYSKAGKKKSFTRPLGLVETSFDTDGRHYGGRADMNAIFEVEIRHTLPSKEAFRRRIALAWANLRLQHVMLMSRTVEDAKTGKRGFAIDVHTSAEEVLQDTLDNMVWVEDLYDEIDEKELLRHCHNVGRIIVPEKCMSKLHVLPLVQLPNGNYRVRFLNVMGHQISDGLTAYNWFSHLVKILNMAEREIEAEIDRFQKEEEIKQRLPPAQEDLYPRIAGNKARQHWFWAIMRVLRHMRKTLPPTFINPLRREKRLEQVISFLPTFSKIFDYAESSKPPMNAAKVVASLSPVASKRMIDLCRSIRVSIGAGCFALAGISMMELHEARYPDIPDADRHAFAASFPLNPRAFFGFKTPADSCMLAFSEGIVMPFLPSNLPIEGRFKLIARHANRELRMYQKRLKGTEVGMGGNLDPHSPGRLLANGYLFQIERVDSKLPPSLQTGINPQGDLPLRTGQYLATCGVSSVGSMASFFKPGAYDLGEVGRVEGKDFAANYRNMEMGVRARDNEFLVGSWTDADGIIGFGVSYDMSAISEEAAEGWARKIESLLEPSDMAKL